MQALNSQTAFILLLTTLFLYSCQKELYNPDTPVISEDKPLPADQKKVVDTFFIRAFYGHQGITPPAVGTVIFPQYNYEVPAVNKMAFMSAYSGINGYGDSAGVIKKNAMNMYNGEVYNDNVNATGNAWVTITPVNRPVPDYSAVSADSTMAYDKFFTQAHQLLITITLVNGTFLHSDTAINGKVTRYRMDQLHLIASESVETGLATTKGAQKLKNGQSETYLSFINQKGLIMLPLSNRDNKVVAWHPHFFR